MLSFYGSGAPKRRAPTVRSTSPVHSTGQVAAYSIQWQTFHDESAARSVEAVPSAGDLDAVETGDGILPAGANCTEREQPAGIDIIASTESLARGGISKNGYDLQCALPAWTSATGAQSWYKSAPKRSSTNGEIRAPNGVATAAISHVNNGAHTHESNSTLNAYDIGVRTYAAAGAKSMTNGWSTNQAAKPSTTPVVENMLASGQVATVNSAVPQSRVRPKPVQPPDSKNIESSLQALEVARARKASEGLESDSTPFNTAICLCSAKGDNLKALELVEEMWCRDLKPDEFALLSAVEACEEAFQPLDRVWAVLSKIWSQGLDPDVEAALRVEADLATCVDVRTCNESGGRGSETFSFASKLRHPPVGVLEDLQRHARCWLRESNALPLQAYSAALNVAGVLRRHDILDREVEDIIRSQILLPIVELLREPISSESPSADTLRVVDSLGCFTHDVCTELGHTSGATGADWEDVARRDLKRGQLLRQWATWEERESTAGSLAWLAYDLNGCASNSGGTAVPGTALTWHLDSCGEVFGRLANIPSIGDDAKLHALLLPPLLRDDRSRDAERHALLALAGRLLQRASEGEHVQGLVLLYSLRPPTVASLYAMRQFQHLFPKIHVRMACGGCGHRDTEPCNAVVERIGKRSNTGIVRISRDEEQPAGGGRHTSVAAAPGAAGSAGGGSSWYARGRGAKDA